MKKLPNPKEKAAHLIDNYYNTFYVRNILEAKRCALSFIKDVEEFSNTNEKVLVGDKYITISKYLSLVEKAIEDYEG